MAKTTRKNMKIFGSTAGPNQLGVFGSLAAGLPAYSTDPETIQSLSNYQEGWYGAVLGNNSPAIQDMNALQYVFAYQLFYLFEMGVPEWNALTTYYIGSIVQNTSTGQLFVSRTNNNLNNALSSATNWQTFQSGTAIRTTTGADTATALDDTVLANATSGGFTQGLPLVADVPTGKRITIKNIATADNDVTVSCASGIDGGTTYLLSSYLAEGGQRIMEQATFVSNGTQWYVV